MYELIGRAIRMAIRAAAVGIILALVLVAPLLLAAGVIGYTGYALGQIVGGRRVARRVRLAQSRADMAARRAAIEAETARIHERAARIEAEAARIEQALGTVDEAPDMPDDTDALDDLEQQVARILADSGFADEVVPDAVGPSPLESLSGEDGGEGDAPENAALRAAVHSLAQFVDSREDVRAAIVRGSGVAIALQMTGIVPGTTTVIRILMNNSDQDV